MAVIRSNPPSASWWSASEVLTWIAFGTASTVHETHSADSRFLSRWKTSDGDELLRVLRALAGEGLDGELAAACCLLTRDFPGGSKNAQLIAERLAADRAQTPSELTRDLEADLAGVRSWSESVARAQKELAEEIRSERISAWGRPTEGVGKPQPGSLHQRISPILFLRPIQVEVWDSIQPDIEHPHFQGETWKGFTFIEVKFKRAEVLAIWPASEGNEAPGSIEGENAQTDLGVLAHAYWNAEMCLAWIASRDEQFTAAMHSCDSGHRLAVRLAWRMAEIGESGTTGLPDAERELLDALKTRRIEATGTSGTGRETIGAEVACRPNAGFKEDHRHRVILETQSSRHGELLFPRETIVRLWPPAASIPGASEHRGGGWLYRHRPPEQRQRALEALRVLYGDNGPPPMKRAALLAAVNQYLTNGGDFPVSRDTLLRALRANDAKAAQK